MKRHSGIALLLLLSFACRNGEHANHETTAPPQTSTTTTTGATMTATNAAAPYDLQFLDTMTHHHQGAIDMVKAAQGRFGHKELADTGEKIVADQQQEIAQMKTWRDQWYPGAPPAVNMDMPGMAEGMNMDMSHMTHLSGNALDVMFLDMMKPHHQGALAMAEDALAKAEHPEIKQLARAIIDAQAREIEQFNAWRKAWAAGK
ncbi:MAG TPA: DUF305 domain-containing protein [Thermoanaerobaculia bacterium]